MHNWHWNPSRKHFWSQMLGSYQLVLCINSYEFGYIIFIGTDSSWLSNRIVNTWQTDAYLRLLSIFLLQTEQKKAKSIHLNILLLLDSLILPCALYQLQYSRYQYAVLFNYYRGQELVKVFQRLSAARLVMATRQWHGNHSQSQGQPLCTRWLFKGLQAESCIDYAIKMDFL